MCVKYCMLMLGETSNINNSIMYKESPELLTLEASPTINIQYSTYVLCSLVP